MDQGLLTSHQVMLGDRTRLRAYDAALSQTVRPGDIVVDVGAGTLILSMLALRHNASHVYAIEGSPEVAALATRIARHNHLEDRVTIVQGDARTVELPTMVDVIVSEMMGNLGPEEEMAEVVAAVAARHLKPTGRVVPACVATSLQAVQLVDEGWGVWTDDFWGFSLRAVQDHAAAAAQLHFFTRPPVEFSAPVVAADDRMGRPASGITPRLRLEITRPGTLQAVIGSFRATLTDTVTLSNHPGYPGCNWAVWLWPLRHVEVRPGMALDVSLRCPADIRVATDWRLDCRLARQARAAAS